MKKKPHHSLEEVKALGVKRRVRLLKTRALDPMMDSLASADTAAKATALAAATIAALTLDAFSDTVQQSFVTCDIYGVVIEERGFFVKLHIDVDARGEDLVICMSFHLLERPLRTNGGTVKP